MRLMTRLLAAAATLSLAGGMALATVSAASASTTSATHTTIPCHRHCHR